MTTATRKFTSGLNKSLAALEKSLATSQKDAQRAQVPCNRIKILPQIRKITNRGFTPASLRELGESIKAVGLIQPITLRPLVGDPDFDYVLIAGERRLRGSMLVGLGTIDTLIRHVTDHEAKTLQRIENVHQEALDDAELLEAVKTDLAELGKASTVAKRWEKTESWVSKVLALNNLGEVAQSLVAEGLSGDREVLTAISRLERDNPDLAKRLVQQIRIAPESNVRNIVNKGLKTAREQRQAVANAATDQSEATEPPKTLTPEKALEHAWAEIVAHDVDGVKALAKHEAIEAEITAFLKKHWRNGKKAAQTRTVTQSIVGGLVRGEYSATADLGQGFAMVAFLQGALKASFSVPSLLDAATAARRTR
jgi:ParB/RepB/Spo0J family partition protein